MKYLYKYAVEEKTDAEKNIAKAKSRLPDLITELANHIRNTVSNKSGEKKEPGVISKNFQTYSDYSQAIAKELDNSDIGVGYLKQPELLQASPILRFSADMNGSVAQKMIAPGLYNNRLRAAEKLGVLMKKHLENPEFPSATEIPRSSVSTKEITETDLRNAGFVPSYVAVPEIGQTEIRTWRHPFSGMHFHKHKDKWRFHVDTYPSMAMQKEMAKQIEDAGIKLRKPGLLELLAEAKPGIKHVMQEGFPGYVNWGTSMIMGDRGIGYEEDRTPLQRVPRALAGFLVATGLLSGASRLSTQLGSKSWNVGESAGAIGALVGTKKLMNAIYAKGVEDGTFKAQPSWTGMTMLGAAPIAASIGTYYGINKLRKLLKKKKDDKVENKGQNKK